MKNFFIIIKLSCIILIFLNNISNVNSAECDKVSSLPKHFDQLLPDYNSQNLIHSSYYIFMDDEENSMNIKVLKDSVIKILVSPKHFDLEFKVEKNNNIIFEKESLYLPVEFSNIGDIDYKLEFESLSRQRSSEFVNYNVIFKSLRSILPSKEEDKDLICNEPYIIFEILIESQLSLFKRLETTKQNISELDKLEDHETIFNTKIFEKMIENSDKNQILSDKDEQNINSYKEFKVSINPIDYYSLIGINVLEEINFSIPVVDSDSDPEDLPELKINSKNKKVNINSKLHLNSLSLQIEMMSDFFISGSYKIVLLKLSETDKEENKNNQLQDYKCIKDKVCLISERSSKNVEKLRAILTSGNYSLLIVNISSYEFKQELEDNNNNNKNFDINYDYNHSDKLIQHKLEYAPLTLRYDMAKLDGQQENRFSCLGSKFPLKVVIDSVFIVNDKIIMDMDNLEDTTEIQVNEDSLLRIISFYEKGNRVQISVFEENKESNTFDEVINNKSNNFNFKNKVSDLIIEKLKVEDSNNKREKVKAFSNYFSEANGIVIPLKGKKIYRLVFNYKDSFINSSNKIGSSSDISCETFDLHLEVKSFKYLKSNYTYLFDECNNSERKKTTKSRLNKYLREFAFASKDHTTFTKINDNEDEYKEDSFEYELDIKNSKGVLMMSSFKLEKDINIYVEIESEFTTSFLVPIIIPKDYYKNNKSNKKLNNEFKKTSDNNDLFDFEEQEALKDLNYFNSIESKSYLFHNNYLSMNLRKGEYFFFIMHGVNQLFDEDSSKFNMKADIRTSANINAQGFDDFNLFGYKEIPTCSRFRLRLTSILLNNKIKKRWSCNNELFRLPPAVLSNKDSIASYSNYFSSHTLIPFSFTTTKIFIPKSSNNSKVLLKLNYEINSDSPLKNLFKIQLIKGGTSQVNRGTIVAEGSHFTIIDKVKTYYNNIYYMIEPNVEYNIEYVFDQGDSINSSVSKTMHLSDFSPETLYFEESNCPHFKLNIELISYEDIVKNKKDEICNYITKDKDFAINENNKEPNEKLKKSFNSGHLAMTPSIDNLIFLKPIDSSHYTSYGTEKTMFSKIYSFFSGIENNNKSKEDIADETDPEKDLYRGIFAYKLNNKERFKREYYFEIKASLAKATLIIEGLDLNTNISGVIYSIKKGEDNKIKSSSIVAKDIIISKDSKQISNLLLTKGHYRLLISESSFNKKINKELLEILNDNCEVFKATLLLETKLDLFNVNLYSKVINSSITCPFKKVPSSLNYPGLLHYSSADTFTLHERYLIESNVKYINFNLSTRSIFKIYLPEKHTEFFSDIKLSKITNKYQILIHEASLSKSNGINIILPKGDYQIALHFSEVGLSSVTDKTNYCNFYELYIAIIPKSNFLNNKIPNEISNQDNTNNSFECLTTNERDMPVINSNKYLEYNEIKIKNKPLSISGEYNGDYAKIIINSHTINKGKFVAEFNVNPYMDTFPEFIVYKSNKNSNNFNKDSDVEYADKHGFTNENEQSNDVGYELYKYRKDESDIESDYELYFHENSVWMSINTEANYDYKIVVFPQSFIDYSDISNSIDKSENNLSIVKNPSAGRNVCSHLVFSAALQIVFGNSQINNNIDKEINNDNIKSQSNKQICNISSPIPDNLHKKLDTLVPYGGNQNSISGEINFSGKFLIPSESKESRTEILIKEDSLLFIKVNSLYEENNGVLISMYKNLERMVNFKHSDSIGINTIKLEKSEYPYYIILSFDKIRENCESIEFSLSIVNIESFEYDILACDNMKEPLPNTEIINYLNSKLDNKNNNNQSTLKNKYINIQKNNNNYQGVFNTQLCLDTNKSKLYDSSFVIDEDGDYIKELKLSLKYPSSVSIASIYSITSASIELAISSVSDKENLIEGSTENIMLSNENLLNNESLNVNLIPGDYIIYIAFKAQYLQNLARAYNYEISNSYISNNNNNGSENLKLKNFCYPFDIELEITELNIRDSDIKNLSIDSNNPYTISESKFIELLQKNLSNTDVTNSIVLVEPSAMNDLQLISKLNVIVKFQLPISSSLLEYFIYNKKIYLQDNNSEYNKIFPKEVMLTKDKNPNEILIEFYIDKDAGIDKCYKLKFEIPDKHLVDNDYSLLYTTDNIDHIYCTTKCDCNPYANFTCINNKCKCKSPYTGEKCDKCVEGFKLSNKGKCIKKALQLCDEKINCSNNGKCVNNKCICKPGFTSTIDATNVFCNKCSDNSKYYYPNCKGESKGDISEIYSFESPCTAYGPSLPELLKYKKSIENTNQEDEENKANNLFTDHGMQYSVDADGSIDFYGIFKFSSFEETMKIFAIEDSIIRVFYESREVNRAKVMILDNLDEDSEPIAYSPGTNPTESFIAKLEKRDSPYYVKIMHSSTKTSCNRYLLKIETQPVVQIVDGLKCSPDFDLKNPLRHLPPLSLSSDSSGINLNADYSIIDYLIVNNIPKERKNKDFKIQNQSIDDEKLYNKEGFYSNGKLDEFFEYNIKITIKNKPLLFYSAVNYDFLTNDIVLTLRNSDGMIINKGEWLIPDYSEDSEDDSNIKNKNNSDTINSNIMNKSTFSMFKHTGLNFFYYITKVLETGVYYLTITQNLGANHLIQMIYDKNNKFKLDSVNRCFDFSLHIQTHVIDKPDSNISTDKYESLFNRIVSVEPESLTNMKPHQRLQIFVTFEAQIKPALKDPTKSFIDVFYLEDNNKNIVKPSSAILQGYMGKLFKIEFKSKFLVADKCYTLKYDISILNSSGDRAIIVDDKDQYKYCTYRCNCNPFSKFKCNSNNEYNDNSHKTCICTKPYTGNYCEQCEDGYIMYNGVCISQENCNKNHCNNHGKCDSHNLYNTQSIVDNEFNINSVMRKPLCICNDYFKGNRNCNACSNSNKIYPNCKDLSNVSKEDINKAKDAVSLKHSNKSLLDREKQINNSKFISNTNINNKDKEKPMNTSNEKANSYNNNEVVDIHKFYNEKCEFPFIPHDLDSLGYLHLTGDMHISGPYSLKHLGNKHFTMHFSLKEKSHVKIYLEHKINNFTIIMILLNSNHDTLETCELHYGPGGLGSSSFINVVLDPSMRDSVANNFSDSGIQQYEIAFLIKSMDNLDNSSYEEITNDEYLFNECFDVYMELEVQKVSTEDNIKKTTNCSNSNPQLIPQDISFNYHSISYETFKSIDKTFTFYRDTNIYNVKESIYFHYEYLYIPDSLDKDVLLKIYIESKFLNQQIGVLIEIVDIPLKIDNKAVNHKNLNANTLKQLDKNLKEPLCENHCFTALKKQNSVMLERMLPPDSYLRIWFYDISPTPQNTNKTDFKCIEYNTSIDISFVESSSFNLRTKKESYLCKERNLPDDLNNKDYLGDAKYIKKWGFHVLDDFRIDESLYNSLTHRMNFEVRDRYYLFRMLLIHGARIETDLELYVVLNNGSESEMIAKSSSKNFEEILLAELAPGTYYVLFKFYPEISGFNKCESIRLEFAMDSLSMIQDNLDRMAKRYNNKPKISDVNIYSHFKTSSSSQGQEAHEKEKKTYLINFEKSFDVSKEDVNDYDPTVFISDISFTISEDQNELVELYASVTSDFTLLDAGLYLTETTSMKTIVANHNKNYNVISSGPLEAGTYVLALRYYKRIHYREYTNATMPKKGTSFNLENEKISELNAEFVEIEFDAKLVNLSKDELSVETNKGIVNLKPRTKTSYNWFCRSYGIPLPSTLNTLRHIQFNKNTHIIDRYLVPTQSNNIKIEKAIVDSLNEDDEEYENNSNDYIEEIIKFQTIDKDQLILRVYVECEDIDINLSLYKVLSNNKKKLVVSSQENSHFETISQFIHPNITYEISLKFKYNTYNDNSSLSSNNNISCKSFKMEIAVEVGHNYACPESNKYIELTKLKPLPDKLPFYGQVSYDESNNKEENKVYVEYLYDSKIHYKGEEKDSGYVYMLRTEQDQEFKVQEFSVTQDIDLKIQVNYDFIQSPLNVFITFANVKEPNFIENIKDNNSDTKETRKPNIIHYDSDIISYGYIHDNRTVLVVNNLPEGMYALWIYLPGLKTRFLHESRVCSIYDVLVEAKKSKTSFHYNNYINPDKLKAESINLPLRLPKNLNTKAYLEDNNYLNVLGDFYLRKDYSEENKDNIVNEITFDLKENSVISLIISHNNEFTYALEIALDDNKYVANISRILDSGKHTIKIKLSGLTVESKNTFEYESMYNAIIAFIGITPVSRYKEIIDYNKIRSNNPMCITKMPNLANEINNDYNKQENTFYKNNNSNTNYNNYDLNIQPILNFVEEESLVYYVYENDFITFNRKDIKSNLELYTFNINLRNESRIFIELGADLVINNLGVYVTSGDTSFESVLNNNIQEIDIIVPPSNYNILIKLDNNLVLDNQDCILFSLMIKIIDIKLSSSLEKELRKYSPLNYSSHNYKQNKNSNSLLLKKRCEIESVLPFELSNNSANIYNDNAMYKGQYALHINKANYYNHHNLAKSKKATNPNSIDINIEDLSIIRVYTRNDELNKISILPKLKSFVDWNYRSSVNNFNYNKDEDKLSNKRYTLPYTSGKMSFENTEHNYAWITNERNLNLQLSKSGINSKSLDENTCIYYGLDIFIYPLDIIVNKHKCGNNNSVQNIDDTEYMLPNKEIPYGSINAITSARNVNGYHENIKYSYITINQYSSLYVQNDHYVGMQYIIDFEIEDTEKDYNINLEFGYDHTISFFDVYLSKKEVKKKGAGEGETEAIKPGSNSNITDNNEEEFSYKVIANSMLIYNKSEDINKYDSNEKQIDEFEYKRVMNHNVGKGKYSIIILEDIFKELNHRIISEDKYKDIRLCLPFSYSLDILPVDESNSRPLILSTFPPAGKVSFHSLNEDVRVTFVLSKQAYTKRHQLITSSKHTRTLLNAVYFTHRKTKQTLNNNKFNQSNQSNNLSEKIFPIKVVGSANNKEWKFTFSSYNFYENIDYVLNFDSSWIVDSTYIPFSLAEKVTALPIIRIETKRQDIQSYVERIVEIKESDNKNMAINSEETKKNKELTIQMQEKNKEAVKGKCGEHGKEIFDNVIKKYTCSCINGFSGKFCTDCEGKIIGQYCFMLEDLEQEKDNNKVALSIDFDDKRYSRYSDKKKKNQTNEYAKSNNSSKNNKEEKDNSNKIDGNEKIYNNNSNNKSQNVTIKCNVECINGICNTKTGKCMCEIGYKGERCDLKISEENNQKQLNYKNFINEDTHADKKDKESILTIFINALFYLV